MLTGKCKAILEQTLYLVRCQAQKGQLPQILNLWETLSIFTLQNTPLRSQNTSIGVFLILNINHKCIRYLMFNELLMTLPAPKRPYTL